jgi:hypothetical protein
LPQQVSRLELARGKPLIVLNGQRQALAGGLPAVLLCLAALLHERDAAQLRFALLRAR